MQVERGRVRAGEHVSSQRSMASPVESLLVRVSQSEEATSTILPSAISLASMLRQRAMLSWLRCEFSGYAEDAVLPINRTRIAALVLVSLPGQGWAKAPLTPERQAELGHLDLRESIPQLEELAQHARKGGGHRVTLSPEHKANLRVATGLDTEHAMSVAREQLIWLCEIPRFVIREWTLDLLDSGIGGERNGFADDEKRLAQNADARFDLLLDNGTKAAQQQAHKLASKPAGMFSRLFGG